MARRAVAKPSDTVQVVSEGEQADVPAKRRLETFERTRPDGVVVVVKRNIDTGEQTVTEK